MTIERIHFPEGYPFLSFPNTENECAEFTIEGYKSFLDNQVEKAITENEYRMEELPEGDTVIIPKRLIEDMPETILTVFDDGTAMSRQLYDKDVRPKSIFEKEDVIFIPKDTERMVYFEPTDKELEMSISNIIIHTPGPNPEETTT